MGIASGRRKSVHAAGMKAYLPLWGRSRREIVTELVELGFQALIVAVNEEKMDRQYLGRVMDRPLMDELESKGIDVAGENGEYHTVITGGPLFQNPITMEVKGLKSYEKHCFLHID
ncbi:MAG: hypothetical protein RQM95_04140 [Syntrophaceticus schinkii]